MDVTQGTIQTLHIAYSAVFNEVMASAPASWEQFALRVNSTTKGNEYSWLRNMPQVKRAFGPLTFEDLIRKGYQVENYRFHVGFKVPVDNIEDDNLAGIEVGVRATMEDAAGFTDRAVHTMLPVGLPGNGGLAFDGLSFFNTGHKTLDASVTYSNLDDAGGGQYWYLVDTKKFVKPIIWQDRKEFMMTVQNKPSDDSVFEDEEVRWKISGRRGFGYTFPQLAYASNQTLNATNLEAAVTAMMQQKSDDGRKLALMPDLLIVGPSNHFAAKKLLENEREAAGASNVHYGSLDLMMSHYVEDVTIEDLVSP